MIAPVGLPSTSQYGFGEWNDRQDVIVTGWWRSQQGRHQRSTVRGDPLSLTNTGQACLEGRDDRSSR
jgi:hypothetical protein